MHLHTANPSKLSELFLHFGKSFLPWCISTLSSLAALQPPVVQGWASDTTLQRCIISFSHWTSGPTCCYCPPSKFRKCPQVFWSACHCAEGTSTSMNNITCTGAAEMASRWGKFQWGRQKQFRREIGGVGCLQMCTDLCRIAGVASCPWTNWERFLGQLLGFGSWERMEPNLTVRWGENE